MRKKEVSPIDRDVRKRIEEDPEFAEVYFEELSERPLSIQLAIFRRLKGVSQVKLASKLHMRQAFISKLEKVDSNHLLRHYEKLAKMLHGRLAIIPEGAKLVFNPNFLR